MDEAVLYNSMHDFKDRHVIPWTLVEDMMYALFKLYLFDVNK